MMSSQTISMPIAARVPSPSRRILAVFPGIALLFAIGLLGKLLEQVFSVLRTQHHLLLPQIEYVLWAIILGLIISNSVGVARVFLPGVARSEEHTSELQSRQYL